MSSRRGGIHYPLGVEHQLWESSLLLFSICWVRPDAKNPSQEVLVEEPIYEGDRVYGPGQINWRALNDTPFQFVQDHCYGLIQSIKLGELTPFDLRTDNGRLSREIFLASLHERGIKIPERLERDQ